MSETDSTIGVNGTNGTNGSLIGLTVREWLSRLDVKLDKVDEKLSSKADKADVAALDKRVRGLELWRAAVIGLAVGFTFNFGVNMAQILHLFG